MSAELAIDINPAAADGRVTVIGLSGSLDSGTYIELDQRMATVADEGARHLVFDLSGLDYIASAGIGVFINCQNRVRAEGGSISLAAPSNSVRQVFSILGLQALFQIHRDVDAAVSAAVEVL